MDGTSPILATTTSTGAACPVLVPERHVHRWADWSLYLHTACSWGRFRRWSSLTWLNSCEKHGCPRQRNRPATAVVEGWEHPGRTSPQ